MNLLRHAAALALVGWYLLVPPMIMPHKDDAIPWITYDSTAPISKWDHVGSFDRAADCEAERQSLLNKPKKDTWVIVPENMSQENVQRSVDERALNAVSAQCIASDDPRLKAR